MEGVSICLSAWQTQNYIEECLDSIANQAWFKEHDNYEILLGIDHCKSTLDKIIKIKDKYKNLRVFFMNKNVGTYITCNSIMSLAKYDWLIRFDTDDIMLPNMVETIMNNTGVGDILRFKLTQFFNDNSSKTSGSYITHGQIGIKKSILMKYGGYMPWKCAADTELITRLEKQVTIKTIDKVLMKYRNSDNSLTKADDTGMRSKLRRTYHEYIHTTSHKKPVIEMTMETFTEVDVSFNPTLLNQNTVIVQDNNIEAPAENVVNSMSIPKKYYNKSRFSNILYPPKKGLTVKIIKH